MDDEKIDELLKKINNQTTEFNAARFEAGIWSRIAKQSDFFFGLRQFAKTFAGPLGWKAAPAALALVIGGVSGSVLAQPESPDEMSVFASDSVYSMTSLLGVDEEKH